MIATLPPASGIVLAGGRARRFGRDKLIEVVEGRQLLHRAVISVAAICREVLVVVAPEAPDPPLPGPEEVRVPIRIVRDLEPFGGPLLGLLAALEVAEDPLVLLVGGDMPDLQPALLAMMLRRLAALEGMDALTLVHRGERRPLPAAMRQGAVLPQARHLVGLGDRSLKGLFGAIRTHDLEEADWRPLDPEASSLRDVDRPEDLARR